MYNRIDFLCKARGITVNKMCTESGASRGALGDLASGKTQSLSHKTVLKIANYFGVPVSEIYDSALEQSKKTKTPAAQGDGLSDDLRELITLWDNASPERRKLALDLLRLS